MRLPPPSPELHRALVLADFANEASMRSLEVAVANHARDLRAADASQYLISSTMRALVDDSLISRVVPIRTSEDRDRLLALAMEWSRGPSL